MNTGDSATRHFRAQSDHLLTGPVEQRFWRPFCNGHNPQLVTRSAATLAEFTALDPEFLGCARLLAYCTDEVVPSRLLDQLAFSAYNFHSSASGGVQFGDCASGGYCGTYAQSINCTIDSSVDNFNNGGRWACTYPDGR